MKSPESYTSPLPLHEVTRLYGAEGLEERFIDEVSELDLPHEESAAIYDAMGLALAAHEGQTRGEHPYSTHILRVGARIMYHFGVTDQEVITAALLHDTVEDVPGRVAGFEINEPKSLLQREAALTVIADRYGEGVAGLVAAVTNPPTVDPNRDKHEQYREHVVEAMTANPRARIIKLSDFIDNCSGIIYNEDPQRALKLARKYLPLVPAMRTFAMDPSTPISMEARDYIIERLDRAEDRCLDLLVA